MPLKIAVVGCGKIADGHVEEIGKIPVSKVVAVCDRELLMAEQIAVRYGVPNYYDDFQSMLDRERPDVVHITTPPQSHLPLARTAIDAGCHVYMEKPLAMNARDAAEILRHAETAGRKLTIGYWYNFEPCALAAQELLRQGVLGDVVHVDSIFGYNMGSAYGSAFLSDPGHWLHRLPGKLFHNIIDHVVNKIVPFVPDDQLQVKAFGFRRREEWRNDASDAVLDELRFLVRGEKVSGFGMFSSHAKPVAHTMKIYGTSNTVSVDFSTRIVTLDRAPVLPSAIGRLLPPFSQAMQFFSQGTGNCMQFARSEFGFFAGMRTLISRFYDSILNDTPPPIPYRDILRVATVLDEIFAQAPQETMTV